MINLKIDPEFQSQIPPLTDDEFKQLEENILKEGKLLSPLIVWGNTLVDGHNRYAILQKHPEIYFRSIPKSTFLPCRSTLQIVRKHSLGFARISWGGAIFPPNKSVTCWGSSTKPRRKLQKSFGAISTL